MTTATISHGQGEVDQLYAETRDVRLLGFLCFIATDLVLFSSFIFAYLYLRNTAQPWPPAGVPHLEIRVDSRDLMPQAQQDGFVVPLNIIFVVYTANGEQGSRSAVNVKLTRAQIEKPSKDDISISQDLPGGISKVKVVVIDSGSNAIGSLTIPIE